MATYNGEPYIADQLKSILEQLRAGDELIVSDDGSTDSTLQICRNYAEMYPAIVFVLTAGPRMGVVRNFENALQKSSGEYIFLADQDDIWLSSKLEKCLLALQDYDLVVTNCRVVNKDLAVLSNDFFAERNSSPGFLKNIFKNGYLGCCMAFNRSVLNASLPFPRSIAMHDWWIGLVTELFGKRIAFLSEPKLLYRRHGKNASDTAEKSSSTLAKKIKWRLNLVCMTLIRRITKPG